MDEQNHSISLEDFIKQYPSVMPILVEKGYAEEDTMDIVYDSDDLTIIWGKPSVYYVYDIIETKKNQNDTFTVIDKKNDKEFILNFFYDRFRDEHNKEINKWDFTKQYPTVVPILVDLGELKKWKNGFKIKTDGNTHYYDMQMINKIEYSVGGTYYSKYDKLHRTDGPAVEYANGDKHWWINGKHHRTDGPAIERVSGEKEWYINGKRHRTDGPAIEYADGGKQWYINGKLHRTDGPAVEFADGEKQWWINGKRHRIDGYTIEYANGGKQWYINGKLHRTDGPAVENADGGKEWYIDGRHHRIDGPAIEYADGEKQWWINGKLHRTDGPAVEYWNGGKKWYINGNEITEDIEQWMSDNNYTAPFDKATQAKFILTFAG